MMVSSRITFTISTMLPYLAILTTIVNEDHQTQPLKRQQEKPIIHRLRQQGAKKNEQRVNTGINEGKTEKYEGEASAGSYLSKRHTHILNKLLNIYYTY
jgi:hypothetical protein